MTSSRKVFDVSRPGRSMASPTSRPLITRSAPIVQDDQIVHKDDDKSVASETSTPPTAPLLKHGALSMKAFKQPKSTETPEVTPKTEVPKPAKTDISEPESKPKPQSTVEEEAEELFKDPIFERNSEPVDNEPNQELEKPVAPAKPVEPTSSTGLETFSSINEMLKEPTDAKRSASSSSSVFVSHHKYKHRVWRALFAIFLIVLIVAVVADFLLDAQFLIVHFNIPHTHFLK